jgi:hypothetical protein
MTLKKCAEEAFGRYASKSSRKEASQSVNIEKLEALFERTDIFPNKAQASKGRDFDENFFWREVKKPKAVGLDRDKKKEDLIQSLGKRALHNVLCVNEEARLDFTEFEEETDPKDDDECASVVSSVVSRAAGSVADMSHADSSSDEDEDETEKKATGTLKQLGNIKKKKMSNLLFKDLLDEDGDEAMIGVKKTHQHELAKVEKQMKFVRTVNRHFEVKVAARMMSVVAKAEASVSKTFHRHDYEWRNEYKEIMSRKRRQRRDNPY